MKYEELRTRVVEANRLLPGYDLVKFTWGNVSEADREAGVFAIKPSGVEYKDLTPEKSWYWTLRGMWWKET